MEIKIHYEGKVRKVTITESDRDPIHFIYECDIEGIGKIEIMWDDDGRLIQLNGGRGFSSPIADLIMKEKERVEKIAETEDTFSLSVMYKDKPYDLRVSPELNYYRVVHAGHFLMNVWPPKGTEHQWHGGYGTDVDQKLAAVIGIAIENR